MRPHIIPLSAIAREPSGHEWRASDRPLALSRFGQGAFAGGRREAKLDSSRRSTNRFLARAAGVSEERVKRIEGTEGRVSASTSTVEALRKALEEASSSCPRMAGRPACDFGGESGRVNHPRDGRRRRSATEERPALRGMNQPVTPVRRDVQLYKLWPQYISVTRVRVELFFSSCRQCPR